MTEKTFDLKSAEEIAATAAGQAEKNAPVVDATVDTTEIESTVDDLLKTGDEGQDDEGDDDDDDTVVVPKKKFERIQRDLGNYREGLIAVKAKAKGLKPKLSEKPAEPPEKKPDLPADVMTTSKFEKINQDKVINDIESGTLLIDGKENPDVVKDLNEHWADIIKLYVPRSGKQTSEAIVKDILDAHILFRARNPKQDDTDAEASRKISQEHGKPTGQADNGSKPPERKHILPQTTSPKDWYPK